MKAQSRSDGRRSLLLRFVPAGVISLLTVAFLMGSTVHAAQRPVDVAAVLPDPVDLGTAESFGVLAGSAVTNTGPTVVNGDLGVSPGTAVSGFPPGIVNGTIHIADAVAAQAQADLTVAYNDIAGRPCDVDLTGQDLGGLTLTPAIYCFSSSAQLTGTLTLDAQGDPDAVFIFQIGSTLTTASGSTVNLINGADACNVFWQVGSSATLGTNSIFVGSILALTSITVTTGATVDGRLLARNGAVTLDDNRITVCDLVCPLGVMVQPDAAEVPRGSQIGFMIEVNGRDKTGPYDVSLKGTLPRNIRGTWSIDPASSSGCSISGGVLSCALDGIQFRETRFVHVTAMSRMQPDVATLKVLMTWRSNGSFQMSGYARVRVV